MKLESRAIERSKHASLRHSYRPRRASPSMKNDKTNRIFRGFIASTTTQRAAHTKRSRFWRNIVSDIDMRKFNKQFIDFERFKAISKLMNPINWILGEEAPCDTRDSLVALALALLVRFPQQRAINFSCRLRQLLSQRTVARIDYSWKDGTTTRPWKCTHNTFFRCCHSQAAVILLPLWLSGGY